jgi:hypothetical protein
MTSDPLFCLFGLRRYMRPVREPEIREGPSLRTERLRQIGDAAIEVLAQNGPRGLTHRAVDRHLALPSSSTSYYCKTRKALMDLAAETILLQDWEDFQRFTSIDGLDLEGLLTHLGSPDCRSRMLARFEFYIEGARDPEFRVQLQDMRRRFMVFVTQALTGKVDILEPDPAAVKIVVEFEAGLFRKLVSDG